MSYSDFEEYPQRLSAAERKNLQTKFSKRLEKSGAELKPVGPKAKLKIATSFWGHAWCRHIETYQDLDYRLARGRTYLRGGAILDLKIEGSAVHALVAGSELYKTKVTFASLESEVWENFCELTSGSIESILELLAAQVPKDVLALVTDPQQGLFPKRQDIRFSCTCLDDADVCKHVAAVLYGVGVRFDEDPALFFSLRGVDPSELLAKANQSLVVDSVKSNADLGAIFDIDLSV